MDNKMITKLKRVFRYLFGGFPFSEANFDYEEYWRQRLQSEEHSISPFKLKLIERFIDEGSGVLDIGCGDGTLLHHLVKTRNIQARGVEVSGKAIELARLKGIKVDRVNITEKDFNLDGTYDYIIISEVLEHLPKPEEVMQRVKGNFTKYLIVTIPNTGFLGERLRLLLGRVPQQWVVHPSEHLRFWTISDFLFWCGQLGFKVESYHGLLDEYYDIKIKLWKYYPKLFSRYVLYLIKETT